MTEITKEEIKELWEWCGFKQNIELKSDYHYEFGKRVGNWHYPNGKATYGYMQEGCLPDLDLNNLFKYAINNLDWDMKREVLSEWIEKYLEGDMKFEVALFRVIQEVIHNGR